MANKRISAAACAAILADARFLPLSDDLYRAWQAIGSDVMACMEECGENPNNITEEEALEMCIDADRLKVFGSNSQSSAFVKELIATHGYPPVLSFLAKHARVL